MLFGNLQMPIGWKISESAIPIHNFKHQGGWRKHVFLQATGLNRDDYYFE
jgi:hypothetical protein